MAVIPDPHEIRAVADRISAQAQALRQRAHLLARTSAELAWRGMAADRFHDVARRMMTALRDAASRLETAAGTLRRHADTVEDTLATLHRVQADITHTTVDVVEAVARGADPRHLIHPVGQVTNGHGQIDPSIHLGDFVRNQP